MGTISIVCLLFTLAGQSAAPNQGRTVDVAFSNGLVWVTARKATLPQILAAWTRAGQTRFEGIERAPDKGAIDVRLEGVPEEEALKSLLGEAGGYTAVLRESASAVESAFARVMIVGAKSPAAPSKAAVQQPPEPEPEPAPIQHLIGPDGTPVPDDQQEPPPFRSMPPGFAEPPDRPGVRDER